MAEPRESQWRLHSGHYLGEISALCFVHLPSHLSSFPYLLAGTGSQMLLYNLESGKIIESFQVLQGTRVHGIACASINCTERSSCAFQIALFGERRVKLFKLHIEVLLSSQNQPHVIVDLALIHSLPKFSHWVLDVSFLKNCACGCRCLAIGFSDNSVRLWDISTFSFVLEVQSSDRCLLYSMRLWGDNLEALRVASGTIFNEIIVWKVVPQHGDSPSTSSLEDGMYVSNSFCDSSPHHFQQHKAANLSKLIGHEGSIFRIAWSSDGSKLVSVSDDRSARIWEVSAEQKYSDKQVEGAAGPVLFGHSARVWDCCIFGSLIVTAGEDCTCRVWGLDGKQLRVIKEHIGRGVWRCLYDPNSSLLITAGFDSAVKVHRLPASLPQSLEGQNDVQQFINRTEIFTGQIPKSPEHIGLMDSKSEYVRCLHFVREDTLYVATNNGYLYHAKFCETQEVKWTKLVQVSECVQIICMDLLSINLPKHSCGVDDWVALGDGKGNMTILRVMGTVCAPEVDFTITWSAAKERQLLGTYWCKASGYRFIFTADPRGGLKLWRLPDPVLSASNTTSTRIFDVSLVAEFTSCFGIRILCLDASLENEVLICGDIRGNLVLFPLSKGMLLEKPAVSDIKISPLSYFKGVHGISSVASISVAKLSSNEIDIRSTGADGCVCYLEYDRDQQNLEFIGMKRVKELSLVQSISACEDLSDDLENCGYAVGFASTNFIIWNLIAEAKVVQIPCGGWRRPHSYYLGDAPETKNCFAYVKDEIIYIYRQWMPPIERKIFSQNLHIQFHGREMHSLCFISENMLVEANGKHGLFDKSSWIATGCEDGTVRLTRYTTGVEGWLTSKLLGEHVGGSAVRSICFVSKMHTIASDVTNLSDGRNGQNALAEDRENNLSLLISVGAKRVLTSWLLRERRPDQKEKSISEEGKNGNGYMRCLRESSSMSFKWLSTEMPTKNCSTHAKTKNNEKMELNGNFASLKTNANSGSFLPENGETESKTCLDDKYEDDWRYLAVTAFLVKCSGSRLSVCFVAVACSDATLALRALVLPHRLWFDVASLVPLSLPVLALQHAVIPKHIPTEENIRIGNVYIIISGATDGSIAFWDMTDSVEAFMQQLSALEEEKFINCKTRPRTGRGSQGGRWWRSLSGHVCKKRPGADSVPLKVEERTNCNLVNHALSGAATKISGAESCPAVCSEAMHNATVCTEAMHNGPLDPEVNTIDSSPGVCEIAPFHVFNNVHQSGVNCLHLSEVQDSQSPDNFLFSLISGGDDQALHCLKFDLSPLSTGGYSENGKPKVIFTVSESAKNYISCGQSHTKNFRIRFLCHERIASAHCSAVKGVWTDGTWVFSTGLDQRIRCWFLEEHCKLIEQTHLIISVPEPEALHARACSRNQYEIAVAGRGMQMVEFSVS